MPPTATPTAAPTATPPERPRGAEINATSTPAPSDAVTPTTTGAALPSLSINDVTGVEPACEGSTAFVFNVTLSPASSSTVTVSYATENGTASAGSDYTAITSGSLTFLPGETSKPISVTVLGGCGTPDPDEHFFVNLSSPNNATIADGQGKGTILGGELLINNVTCPEGDAGTTPCVFTVTLSSTSATVTVQFATAPGTATAPADYVHTLGTLTFTGGPATQSITVQITGEPSDCENNETFFVNLSGATNARIHDPQGVGTIDDAFNIECG